MKTKNLILSVMFVALASFLVSMTVPLDGWVAPEAYKNKKNINLGKKDSEGIGKEIYNNSCASCHGAKGLGDGKKAGNLETEMKEFSSKEVKALTDGELYWKTFVKGNGEMPTFGSIKGESDRWFVVNYMRTLK